MVLPSSTCDAYGLTKRVGRGMVWGMATRKRMSQQRRRDLAEGKRKPRKHERKEVEEERSHFVGSSWPGSGAPPAVGVVVGPSGAARPSRWQGNRRLPPMPAGLPSLADVDAVLVSRHPCRVARAFLLSTVRRGAPAPACRRQRVDWAVPAAFAACGLPAWRPGQVRRAMRKRMVLPDTVERKP